MIQQEYQASYTATAATTTISSKKALLHSVNIPKATVGTLSYQDSSSNVYFAIPTAASAGSYQYDMVCNNGLKLVQSSASDQITTTYQE